MDQDVAVAIVPVLQEFARQHNLPLISDGDIISIPINGNYSDLFNTRPEPSREEHAYIQVLQGYSIPMEIALRPEFSPRDYRVLGERIISVRSVVWKGQKNDGIPEEVYPGEYIFIREVGHPGHPVTREVHNSRELAEFLEEAYSRLSTPTNFLPFRISVSR